MDNSHPVECSAAAFQLAASLEAYEADLEAFSRSGFDPGRYRLLVHELRDMGARSVALPQLAGDLMQIAMQHFDLIRLLCRGKPAGEGMRDQAQTELVQTQCEAIRAVREKCLRMIPSAHPRRGTDGTRRCRAEVVVRSEVSAQPRPVCTLRRYS
jgi:hypothetical protein